MSYKIKIGLIIMGLICCFGCEPPPLYCSFNKEQMVRAKLSGQTGQILEVLAFQYSKPPECRYTVRFEGLQEYTNSRVLSDGGPIVRTPLYALRGVREFELEKK